MTDDMYLDGFEKVIFRKDVSAHSSALLIYVSDELLVESKAELETNLDESLWIQVRHKGKLVLLCNTYTPPPPPPP